MVKRSFMDGRHGQIHLRTSGKASDQPAVLCLHMMPKSGRTFSALMDSLAADRLIIAPDYPGYGESDGFPDHLKPTIYDYTDAIEDVITHFQLNTIDLVGYHTGAMIAVELAHRLPQKVHKVINISAPILTDQEVLDFQQYFAPIPLDQEGTRYRVMWEKVLKYSGPGMTMEMAAISMAENLRGGERYEDGHRAAFKHSQRYAETLNKIDQPVWVMNLGDDLFEHSKRADNYLNNGTRTDFPDWGHGCLELWPQEMAALMLEFFND